MLFLMSAKYFLWSLSMPSVFVLSLLLFQFKDTLLLIFTACASDLPAFCFQLFMLHFKRLL